MGKYRKSTAKGCQPSASPSRLECVEPGLSQSIEADNANGS